VWGEGMKPMRMIIFAAVLGVMPLAAVG